MLQTDAVDLSAYTAHAELEMLWLRRRGEETVWCPVGQQQQCPSGLWLLHWNLHERALSCHSFAVDTEAVLSPFGSIPTLGITHLSLARIR